MLAPRIRPEIFELYWRFAYERHRVFEMRVAGIEGPWTDDPILQKYKFCNAYRAADRVSQYLIRHVCYSDEANTWEDRLFQIVAFRTFSHIGTWKFLCDYLGSNPTIEHLRTGTFEEALSAARLKNGRLYTGAFILCATDMYGRDQKHLNHVELFKHMFVLGSLAQEVSQAHHMSEVYRALHAYPLMGDFMSYQIAVDINYSELTDFSENEFTQPGPGALRGIRKIFTDIGKWRPADVVFWMVDQQETAFENQNIDFQGLWGRPLHAIDIQNLFCEVDKYCREAAPHLTSGRTRIKSKFAPTPEALPLFFPPKWQINPLLPSTVDSAGSLSRLSLEVGPGGQTKAKVAP
jgi:hypothetical protein